MDDQNQSSEPQQPQTPQPEPSLTPPPEPDGPSSTINTSPPKKRSTSRKYILALIVIVAFIAAIWAAEQITNKNSPSSGAGKHDVALLKVGSSQPFPTSYYPKMSTDAWTSEINNQAFEGLTKFVNQTQVVADLATGWTNPNNTTWVFNLRHGVKFHDGRTMTASQVVASLTKIKNYPVGQEVPYTIKTVTATDPYTVKITTSQPDPLLDRELTNFWIWDTSDTKTPNNPINGTGPYTLKPGTKLTSTSIQYVAYDSYHGGQPTVKALNFYYYATTPDLLSAMKQDKLDVADLTSSSASYSTQATNDGFRLLNIVNPLVYYIIPNTLKQGSPLQNLKVRQAIYMTLDPTLLAKAHGVADSIPATQLVTPQIPGYNPNIKRPAINPTAAKALLAQAGYPNGFSLSFMYYAGDHTGIGQELQKELSAIGITVNLLPETDLNVLGEKVGNGSIDMYFEGDSSTILDTSDVAAAFVIDSPEYSNSAVDSLFNQAQQTFNPTTRLKLLQQLNATVVNDLAVFPLWSPTSQYIAYRPGLVLSQQYIGGETGIYYWQIYSNQ